ncbi:hypothetical protein A1O1_09046 [Capronia coronata CBS 617.96]|uniref:Uncharacterized protein n=1 Tax=Capronia coronata CBS 617.96 TaxID=1182541 RepID=W9XMT7_9EURO|nr:uncharacterized protein A1O1_09046 [Capronia coronata CBS 617.96]EXJ78645.1 hypothetical protein A1O1_09046 [Capronia coronata CBS 617.96]
MGDSHSESVSNGQPVEATSTPNSITTTTSALPSDLEALILSRFDDLVAKGELIWEPSTAEIVEDQGFKVHQTRSLPSQTLSSKYDITKTNTSRTTLQVEIRYVPHLRRKPIIPSDAPERKTGKGRNPFVNPDPAFVLCPVGPNHLLLLNKYCVYRPSLLLVTKQFVPQSDGLDGNDLATAWALLHHASLSRPYMMIYNCGYEAGSSQGHKHMQLWEYPGKAELGFELFPNQAESEVTIASDIANVPHKHFVLRLPEDADEAYLVQAYDKLLAEVRKAHEDAAADEGSDSAYNVVMVKEWICLVPRRHCGLQRGAGANAAAIVGMVWISALDERETWTSPGVREYFKYLGIPR